MIQLLFSHWIGLRENLQESPSNYLYFMVKTHGFPVKIWQTQPIHWFSSWENDEMHWQTMIHPLIIHITSYSHQVSDGIIGQRIFRHTHLSRVFQNHQLQIRRGLHFVHEPANICQLHGGHPLNRSEDLDNLASLTYLFFNCGSGWIVVAPSYCWSWSPWVFGAGNETVER